MRRQLNTLYVTTEGAWLHLDGANLVMEVERQERARIPVHMLQGLVCFGRVLVSPPLRPARRMAPPNLPRYGRP